MFKLLATILSLVILYATPGMAVARDALADDVSDTAPAYSASNPSAAPTIGAVSLSGAEGLNYAELASSFEPFIGQPAEPLVLQTLARTLADAARERGYMFATAVVPSQTVAMGVVQVRLELGAIDRVRIIGSENERLTAVLDLLVGPAPTASKVERQLLLAGDLPGMTVLGTRYDRQNGMGVLEVRVSDLGKRGAISFDNYGPRAYGPARARLSADFFDVARAGDQLSVQLIRALDNDELSYGGLRYSASIRDGAALVGAAVSVANSEPGGDFTYPLAGESKYVAVFSNWNLKRSRIASAWLNTEVAFLGVDQSTSGAVFQRERTLTASASLSGNRVVGKGRLSGEIGITRGLAPASRLGSDGLPPPRTQASSRFTKVSAWLSYFRPIKSKSAVRITAQAQGASQPLPSSQELGLGGPGFGRAFDFNERFGDQGVLASVEVTRNLKPFASAKAVQVFAFVDGGKVTEHGTRRLGEGSLASLGAGIRLQKAGFDVDFNAALPLNSDRFATGDRSPRLNLMISRRF